MAEYIERDATIKAILNKEDREIENDYEFCLGLIVASNAVSDVPAADVQPVRHARNIYNTVPEHCEFMCSLCGAELSTVYGGRNDFGMDGGYLKYCPNCGAKMDKED